VANDFFEAMTHLPPLARFAIALIIFLTTPALCQRVRLPAVVGLLAAGVIFGPSGLHIAPKHSEVAHFFAELGKLLLMFFAGLEIDLTQFQRVRHRALGFGVASFGLPLLLGCGLGLLFGYSPLSSLLIGSVFASHTLLGYPIAQRLGLMRNEAVTVTIGGTILTDVAALLVVGICIPIHTAGFSTSGFLLQLVELAIYIPVVLIGLSKAGHWIRTRWNLSKEGQLLLILLTVVVAAIGAEAIHLEGIIGAFLAGLAVNRAVEGTHGKEVLEFLGNTLFIPAFFVTIGLLIDVRGFVDTIVNNPVLVCCFVAIPIVAKLLAGVGIQRILGYTRDEGLIMWALSLPRVASALAVALTAYEAKDASGARLIDERIVNNVLILMVVTSVLGPILTEVFGKRIVVKEESQTAPKDSTTPIVEDEPATAPLSPG
jgi:Kef-type K+ transport system membrane component KefB